MGITIRSRRKKESIFSRTRNRRRPALVLLLHVLLFQSISNGAAALIITTQSSSDALERFQAWNNANTNINTLQEFTVKEEVLPDDVRSCRLSHFAATVFTDSLQTSNAANLACRSGKLMLNHAKVSGARRVKTGDTITYLNDRSDRRTTVPDDPERAERFCQSRLRLVRTLSDEGFSHSPLRVLYEDNCMAIVCKPAGIHSMSWAGSFGKSLCLDEILPLVLEPPSGSGAGSGSGSGTAPDMKMNMDEPLPAPLPRHRLDQRVAGPVVVAKTRRALVEIGRSFEEKTVTKEYRAIVVGEIQNIHNSTSFTIHSDVDGRASETHVVVLGQTPCNVNGVLTDLKLFPKTGRRHQLRIHCAEVLGTPILGDDLHSGKQTRNENKNKNEGGENVGVGAGVGVPVRRRQGLYLYCKKVSIDHPINGEVVSAEILEPFRFTRTRNKALKGFEWAARNK